MAHMHLTCKTQAHMAQLWMRRFGVFVVAAVLALATPAVASAQPALGLPGQPQLNPARTTGAVPVRWSPASGTAVTYDVVYSTNNRHTWHRAATETTAASHTITGADDTKAYIVAVRAKDANNNYSGWVNSQSFAPHQTQAQVQTPLGLPGQPELNPARATGAVPVRWSPASGTAVTYDVVYSTNNRHTWHRAATETTAASHTITGADDTKAYIVAVRAKDANNNYSGWVNSQSFAPHQAQAQGQGQAQSSVGVPGIPFIQFSGRGDATLPVLWKEASGSNVTYDVVFSSDNKHSWHRAATNITATRCTSQQAGGHNHTNSVCYTITGPEGTTTPLDNTKTYVVAVRAHSGSASSRWVNSDPFLPIETPRVTAYQMSCPSSGPYVLFVSWASFDENNTSKVRYKIDEGTWKNLPAEGANTPDHRRIQKAGAARWLEWLGRLPKQSDEYSVTVQVQTSKTVGGETITSQWSGPTFKAGTDANVTRWLTRCPAKPTNLRKTSATINSLTVSWDAVTSTSPVVYDLRYKQAGGGWRYGHTGFEGTTRTITGLSRNLFYDVEVRARLRDQSSSSDWSLLKSTSVRTLSVSSVTASSATLALSGWSSQWWVKQTMPSEGSCIDAGTSPTVNITGLDAGTTYEYSAYFAVVGFQNEQGANAANSCTTLATQPVTFTTASTVSNLFVANRSGSEPFSQNDTIAQPFTTGRVHDSYTLNSVTAFLNAPSGSAGTQTLSLWSSSNMRPDELLTRLSSSEEVDNRGIHEEYEFTCSTNCSLSGSTTYFIVTDAGHGETMNWAHTAMTTEVKDPNTDSWTIGDLRFNGDRGPTWTQANTPVLIRIAYLP